MPTDPALIAISGDFLIYDEHGTTWQPDAPSSLEYVVRDREGVQSTARSDLWRTTADGIVESLGFGARGPSDEKRGPLLAVDGDSDNAIAVGADGTIMRAALTRTPGCQ